METKHTKEEGGKKVKQKENGKKKEREEEIYLYIIQHNGSGNSIILPKIGLVKETYTQDQPLMK